jgi:SAM-dependent methyltransferase
MVERLVPSEPAWAEFAAAHLARYLFAAEHARGQRVLDAGCGSGYGCRILREAGATDVVGVDVDEETIRNARRNFGGPGIRFIVDDCETLESAGGPFDVICSFESIEHLRRPDEFLAAASRILGDAGTLVVSTPNRAWTPPFVNGNPRNRFHVLEWYRDEFRALLQKYFQDVDMRVQVESTGLRRRIDAAAYLTRRLTRWPLAFGRRKRHGSLAGLAAPSVADYPIVPEPTSDLFGAAAFHVALCRRPRVPAS